MRKIEKLYRDLTGTPYIKCWFIGNGIVTKVKSYKMEEKIVCEYGRFETPDIKKLIFHKNVYYAYYNIDNCKQNELLNNDQIKDMPYLNMFGRVISPNELQAICNRESLLNALVKDKKLGDALNIQTLLLIGGILIAAFLAYKYLTTGGF